MTNDLLGLEKVWDLIISWAPGTLLGSVEQVLGPMAFAGSSAPLPSSAARLQLGEEIVWVPAPEVPGDPKEGRAPFYRHAGSLLVMPTIRLFPGDPGERDPEYLSLAHWLEDAFTRWRFPLAGREDHTTSTVTDYLGRSPPTVSQVLHLVAFVVRYALFGADRPFRLAGLDFPRAPTWLRPTGETALARAAAQALVITARLDQKSPTELTPADFQEEGGVCLPHHAIRARGYRMRPRDNRDWGLDPVHTPEGADIRLTGRLGQGVRVGNDRRLQVSAGGEVTLGPSSARLPFAGYNDPRRLLMAANIQTQAIEVLAGTTPRVRQDPHGPDPPGVNLRVAYLAWQGWNHEDAWVLSESAAIRLAAEHTTVHTLTLRSVEGLGRLLVQPGQEVHAGQLLLERSMAPALLTDDLEVLARLADLNEEMRLPVEPGDRASHEGTIVQIDTWDILHGKGVPTDWHVPADLASKYRAVHRLHVRRRLPLSVGDKLANRHGHKGVVGAILPDAEMPRWQDQSLDALIDPIGVLNRSNWGQVYETLAGALDGIGGWTQEGLTGPEVLNRVRALGADERGCWELQPPEVGTWLTTPVRAVAGWQFVMRLPQHASAKLSASPRPKSRSDIRPRAQRLGEMDHWALWAHGIAQAPGEKILTGPAAHLVRLLGSAGFALVPQGENLVVQRYPLDRDPPADSVVFPLFLPTAASGKVRKSHESLSSLYERLDRVCAGPLTFLEFDPPLEGVARVGGDPSSNKTPLRWLPLLPACDRPECRLWNNTQEPHELTRLLRRVVRTARVRIQPSSFSTSASSAEDDLRLAVGRYLREAYTLAVGSRATGMGSSKFAVLRRQVLGARLSPSGRAVIAPAGPLGLALDEVGIPRPLLETLLGKPLPERDEDCSSFLAGCLIWLKRDPVLHRWGLVAVRPRPIPGDVLRLPASLLGPMGGDFDGDTMALFGRIPAAGTEASACRPPMLAHHDLTGRAMFFPAKQYLYGLHRLVNRPALLQAMQKELRQAGAPEWPLDAEANDGLRQWVLQAAGHPKPDATWWALIEKFALRGLAEDPAMQFGAMTAPDLARLPVVRCGAAKNYYEGEVDLPLQGLLLEGRSLQRYRGGTDKVWAEVLDPIAGVMVEAKASIGRFGGALRRLLLAIPDLTPQDARNAQCLTEQVTQRALSVKAGQPPLSVGDFDRQLRRLLSGQDWKLEEDSELYKALAPLREVWEKLRQRLVGAQPAWLEWLAKPHELARLVDEHGCLRLPLEDLRMQSWWQELIEDISLSD